KASCRESTLSHRLSPPFLAGRQVRFSYIRIDLDAVTGLVLNGEIATVEDGSLMDHQVLPPIDILSQLVNPERAHGRRRVRRSDSAQRAGRIVSRGPDVVEIGQIGYALRFQQAPGFRNIDVDRVASLQLDQLAKTVARIEVLAGADRHVDG